MSRCVSIDHSLPRHARGVLEGKPWIAHVVEHPQKEDDVKCAANALGREFQHVDLKSLHPRSERFTHGIESSFACLQPPRQRVGRQHVFGSAPLTFEREETIPCADVEHGLS
jgi:hypothetical protein